MMKSWEVKEQMNRQEEKKKMNGWKEEEFEIGGNIPYQHPMGEMNEEFNDKVAKDFVPLRLGCSISGV